MSAELLALEADGPVRLDRGRPQHGHARLPGTHPRTPAREAPHRVRENRTPPGPERAPGREATRRAEELDERLRGRVLRERGVTQHAVREAMRGGVTPAHDLLEGRPVALHEGSEQGFIAPHVGQGQTSEPQDHAVLPRRDCPREGSRITARSISS